MLTLAGQADADNRAEAVFAVETRIAGAHWTRTERRNSGKTYNPMTIAELKTLAPGFPWDAFLSEAGIPPTTRNGPREVVVGEKSAFPLIAKIFAETPVAVWRDYLTVHYLHSFAAVLPKKFDDTDFAFYGTVLRGQAQQLDRPTRGVRLLDNLLGEALGKLYVAKYFPPEAKAKATELVNNLLRAYEADIQTLSWMSQATRQKALEKLHKFTPHIGYPDKWRDYSAYNVARDDLLGDVQGAAVFDWNRLVSRLSTNPPTRASGADAADDQRLLRSVVQRDRVPRRDPAAAVLRSECGRRGELWRHRCRDRS